MNVGWGLVVLVSSAFAWGGQALSWLAPDLAVRLGLTEGPGDIDRTFLVDVRAEAVWDSFVLWTMPLAGVLLMTDHDWWPYLGLIGGGAQLYYAGRGIVVRASMQREHVSIGDPNSVRAAIAALAVWAVVAIVTIVAAILSLEGT